MADQKFTMPFLNTRFYWDEGMYSIDFYDDPTRPDYVEQFLRAWRQVTRDPRFRDLGGTLRSTPFYFTMCPRCSIQILTNRDHGKSLTCRRCEATHETSTVRDKELDELLDSILARLGKRLVDITGHIQVLVLVLPEEKQMKMVEGICHNAGFDPLPKEHPTVIHLLMEFRNRSLLTLTQSYSAWQKVSPVTYRVYAGETPPEVEQVLRTIRTNVAGVYSMSITYDPNDTSPMGLALSGDMEAVEGHLRQELQGNPNNNNALLGLTEVLLIRERYEEALEKALAATLLQQNNARSWVLLGRAAWSCNHFQEAAEALEKALALNPVDRHSTFLLSLCYQELGETDKAAVLFARSQSLGGIE